MQMMLEDARPEPAPPPVFEEYPKVMVHPHARRAETTGVPGTEIIDSLGRNIGYRQYTGTADYMAPVTVYNADQEGFHRAQGYTLGGAFSAVAFAQMAAAPAAPLREIERYPMWVGDVLVANAREEAAARQSEPEGLEVRAAAPMSGEEQAQPTPSPWAAEDLAAMIGPRPMTRSEIAKATWAKRKSAA